MEEINKIPAYVFLFLEDESMLIEQWELEKNADSFAFVDWNVMLEIANHLRMLSETHSIGQIEIHENKFFTFRVFDEPV